MQARLKMSPGKDCWDKVTLFLDPKARVCTLFRLKNRLTALELYRQLTVAHFDGHEGDLTVEIDGNTYCWSQEQWEAVLSCVDQWFELYMFVVEGVGK